MSETGVYDDYREAVSPRTSRRFRVVDTNGRGIPCANISTADGFDLELGRLQLQESAHRLGTNLNELLAASAGAFAPKEAPYVRWSPAEREVIVEQLLRPDPFDDRDPESSDGSAADAE